MTRPRYLLMLMLLLAPLAAQAVGDPVKGKQKAQACVSCHGENGISPNPNVPNLAGQIQNYMKQQWDGYSAGKNNDEVMKNVAAMFQKGEEINDIMAYYASLPRRKGPGKITPTAQLKASATYLTMYNCYQCHGEKGEGAESAKLSSPRLAGQNKAYLVKAMKDYRSGARIPARYSLMDQIMPLVGDEDIEAMAEYLSNL